MSDSVSNQHKLYDQQVENWRSTRAAIEGEQALRRDIQRYLPIPPGMANSPEYVLGGKRMSDMRYHFYSGFAEFPEIVSPTLGGMLGLIHEKNPEIILPQRMEYLIENATPTGENIFELWERITQEILSTGRIVLLMDVYNDQLKFCPYTAESMINWKLTPKQFGGDFRLVVLKELQFQESSDDEFKMEEITIYRVLRVNEEGVYTVQLYKKGDENQSVVISDPETGEDIIIPELFGKKFPKIPIIVINSMNVGEDYGPIPILPMAKRALSIFRKSADYHRALYMKADPQVVLTGVQEGDAPTMIGGGSIWVFENVDAKAAYLDIDGQGIPLMRQAINDEFERFADEVGMLFEGVTSGYESGEALRRRQAIRQVTIKSLVINAATGLETALKRMAEFSGLNPNEVKVTPNLEFTEAPMLGQELREFITAKKMGAPISLESLHNLMRKRQLTDMEFEREIQAIQNELLLGDMKIAVMEAENE